MRVAGYRLEVVTPQGVLLEVDGVDAVVVRRREKRFEWGSEVVFLREHAPTLVGLADCRLRYHRAGRVAEVDVHGGVAEVLGGTVLVVSPRAEHRSV